MFNNNATFRIITTDPNDFIEANASGSTATFNNSATGTVIKAFEGTITFKPDNFVNAGTVDIDTGTLLVSTRVTHTGVYDVAQGATLQSTASPHDIATANPFGALSAGRFHITGGKVNFNSASTTTPSTLEVDLASGEIAGSGDLQINGLMNLPAASCGVSNRSKSRPCSP